ncbi:hypothetical protein CTheo_7 [Ceratobasidium theobromae]|uniref:BTB domain-containing protein n=1 Tax=Ceratobasidium theobromae TaxID=1582974 RepID=A0A5N5QXA6_9AGAM|nr:hypothetical protein CTheo_7 [Ceratobasidium theobromae]
MSNIGDTPTTTTIEIFQPQGGDLTLRSSDSVEFRVHSIFMSVASSVFNDMLTVGSGSASDSTVQLNEDAETISLMLQNIYPITSPAITTFELLEKAIQAAQKYDLHRLRDNVDRELCLGTQNPLIKQDPLRACILCDTYGLSRARDVNARAVDSSVNLRCAEGLLDLSKRLPGSALAIRLVGVQCVKASILVDVLFRFQEEPMAAYPEMMCQSCQPRTSSSYGRGGEAVVYWKHKWSLAVYRRILEAGPNTLTTQLNTIIQLPPKRLLSGTSVCSGCLSVIARDDAYSRWANGIKAELVRRLSSEELTSLY